MQFLYGKHALESRNRTEMQYLEKSGVEMQCSKLICMQKGYCPFKMDLHAKMQSQKVKNAMQYAKIRNKT